MNSAYAAVPDHRPRASPSSRLVVSLWPWVTIVGGPLESFVLPSVARPSPWSAAANPAQDRQKWYFSIQIEAQSECWRSTNSDLEAAGGAATRASYAVADDYPTPAT
jgi:hypothetical protein